MENVCILFRPVLGRVMVWRRRDDKPLSEPLMTMFIDAFVPQSASKIYGLIQNSRNFTYCMEITDGST